MRFIHMPPDIRATEKYPSGPYGIRLIGWGYVIAGIILGLIVVAKVNIFPFLRLLIFFALPIGIYYWQYAEVGKVISRRRRFTNEPETRTSAEDAKNIQEIIAVKETSGMYVITTAGLVHIFLQVTPGPWPTRTAEQKDQSGIAWEQAVGRVCGHGLEMDAWGINDLEILRSELSRQEKAQEHLPQVLKDVGASRRKRWEYLGGSGFSRVSSYYIRISANPSALEIHPKPKSKGERLEKTKQILSETTREVIEKLRGAGASVVYLADETLRDVAARQLRPDQHREADPVRGCDWIRPTEEELGPDPCKGKKPVVDVMEPIRKSAGEAQEQWETRKLLKKIPDIFLPKRGKVAPGREKPLRLLPLIYQVTRPVRRLLPALQNSITLIVVLRTADDDTPGLAMVVNELYAAYETVYPVPMVYHRGTVPEYVERAMRAGYLFIVVPNPDKWSDYDLQTFSALLRATASPYGCKLDISAVHSDGHLEPI